MSYYGDAKLASEALISSYTAMCDMNVVIFRFPNVSGLRLTARYLILNKTTGLIHIRIITAAMDKTIPYTLFVGKQFYHARAPL